MDEKKKLMILIALVAVIASVGAFQLLKKPAAPPPPPPSAPGAGSTGKVEALAPDPTAVAAKATKAPEIKNPLVANELPHRNPFELPYDQRPHVPVTNVVAPQPRPFPAVRHFPNLSPLAPAGKFDVGQLSPLTSSHPAAEGPKPFGYQVVAAIRGDRSAVVLQDSAGNQKLVPEGAAIDGDSRVRRVENGAVTIEYRGKKLRLSVGGNPVDKK